MGSIEIRFAQKNEIPLIMEFIDTHWKRGHIMAADRQLFEFQHVWGQEVTFVIAWQKSVICGILGFIPYGTGKRDIMLAIWKALKTENRMTGIQMLEFLRKDKNTRSLSAPGINKKTRTAYEFLGIHTGQMRHWYRLKRQESYQIAKIVDASVRKHIVSDGICVQKFSSFEKMMLSFPLEDCLSRAHKPYKSLEYVKRRYFCHPVFSYLICGCTHEEGRMLLILRIQSCGDAKALRVIDCIGDHALLRYSTSFLDRLLKETDCEYVDCYETGVGEDVFRDGGWSLTAETENLIPEYFSPFEQRNIDIYYMSEIEDAVLFKGDGDMDRPN